MRQRGCFVSGIGGHSGGGPTNEAHVGTLFALPQGFWLVVPRIPSFGVRLGIPFCGGDVGEVRNHRGQLRVRAGGGTSEAHAPMTCAPEPPHSSGSGSPHRYNTCGVRACEPEAGRPSRDRLHLKAADSAHDHLSRHR